MARRDARLRFVMRGATRVVALLAVVALLVGVLRGNARYFYCPLSHVIAQRSCCAAPVAPSEDDGSQAIDAVDCCQVKRIGALPAGAVAPTPDVPSAPLLALVPSIASNVATAIARSAQTVRVDASTGPPPRAPTSVRTMVFLI